MVSVYFVWGKEAHVGKFGQEVDAAQTKKSVIQNSDFQRYIIWHL